MEVGHSRPKLTDMKTWTDRTGHGRPRSFSDEDGKLWLEQNPVKPSRWRNWRGAVTRLHGSLVRAALIQAACSLMARSTHRQRQPRSS